MEENDFEEKAYIEFIERFRKIVFTSVLALGAAFLVTIVLIRFDYTLPAIALGIICTLAAIGILSLLFFRLRHILCPTCHKLCEPVTDRQTKEFKAFCPHCKVRWCLGITKNLPFS